MKDIRVLASFAAGLLAALGVGVAIGAQTSQGGGADFTRFAALSGAKEIGTDGQGNAGDRCAHSSGRARKERRRRAPAQAAEDGRPRPSSQCIHVPASLKDDISDNPRRFYVNVHTEKFPSGAIRGQLNGG